MKVIIEQERICIGLDCFRYHSAYLKLWTEGGKTEKARNGLNVMKNMLQQWADTLAGMGIAYDKLYLPYSLDDETIECFEATTKSPPIASECRVTLRWVVVEENGYALDLDHLYQFMTSKHNVFEKAPADFGVYDKDELMQALSDAQVISP